MSLILLHWWKDISSAKRWAPNSKKALVAQADLVYLLFSPSRSSFTAIVMFKPYFAGWRTGMGMKEEAMGSALATKLVISEGPTGFHSLLYGIPLIATSTLLHWLVSQSIFFVKVIVYRDNKISEKGNNILACGWSALALLLAIILGCLVMIVTIGIMYRSFTPAIPIGGTCSAVISAACHAPDSDEGAAKTFLIVLSRVRKLKHQHLGSFINEAIYLVNGEKRACLWGLEHANKPLRVSLGSSMGVPGGPSPTVTGRISKYSYGVAVSVPFDLSRHLLDEATNDYRASNQMCWLLRRGEKVTAERRLDIKIVNDVHGVGFTSSGYRDFTQALFYCQDNDTPPRKEDSVKELCHVNYSVPESTIWKEKSFRSAARPGKWRSMVVGLIVDLGNATLDYVVTYRRELVGHVEAEYVEPLSKGAEG
ncbi:hypothetical protein FSARC_14493 [Fusarium sarcochroum]|uniref:Uncharacterized protein n=1 Tax=Fusarium sarcochroum TaxID=1208366 RepID=A0A8H4WPL0_9HYPO|nr:hypothetical protein FSARC_14493 [Fusarium sarcochroum]